MPDRITEDLADQQDGHIPARMPLAEYRRTHGRPAPAPPARQASRSPGPLPQPSVHPPSRRPRPGNRAGRRADTPDARPTQRRASSQHTPQRGPSVPSVENPAVTPTVLPARNPSAMRPWTTQHDGLQRYKVTHAGTEKKRPASCENSQLAGRFRRWWQVLGSNQRRLSRRFYSPSLLPEVHSADQHIRRSRRRPAPPPSAMRPCVPGLVHGRGRKNPRTGAVGAVTPTVRPAFGL